MDSTYNPWLVTLSVVVAMVVSYTALTLTARVAEGGRASGRYWLLGGAVAMGIGIWSMHFIGMLAFVVPIQLRYGVSRTLFSLLIAIVTSGFALAIASRAHLSRIRLAVGALLMGSGICSMHYMGMAAIRIAPPIRYDAGWVAASFAIAVAASAAALWLAFRLRGDDTVSNLPARSAAAAVMGLAISGMHYTGMAACHLAEGAVCFEGTAFDNLLLALAIGLFSLGLLTVALITSVYDAKLVARVREDARNLAAVNVSLEQGRNLLSLATQAGGISLWELDLSAQRLLWIENALPSLRSAGVDLRETPNAGWDLTHPEDRDALTHAVRQAVAEDRDTCSIHTRLVLPTGQVIHIESHMRIFFEPVGTPARVLGASWEITERIEHQEREQELQARLRQASREAGMAEVAAGVLHNIGNVLNSLGVAVQMVRAQLAESRVGQLQKVVDLIDRQGTDAGRWLTEEERGRKTLEYLGQLSGVLGSERQTLVEETEAIEEHVAHIRNIVAAQQAFTGRGGVLEPIDLAKLLDQCLVTHFDAEGPAEIRRHYDPVPPLMGDRHKIMQIVINLLSNARQAMAQEPVNGTPHRLTVSLVGASPDRQVSVVVQDTGVGITSEALARLFEFGFTTKPDGHGYGLHNSALLAREMGGELLARSEGAGQGAEFELRLPLKTVERPPAPRPAGSARPAPAETSS